MLNLRQDMDKRFEQVDKRFDAMISRIDNFMKWSISMTFVASGLVITILQYLNNTSA
jgi:hypothetical protein